MTRSLLGPFRPLPHPGVAVDDRGATVTLTANAELAGVATGRFPDVTMGASLELAECVAPVADLLGFAFTQFAMPVRATPTRPFDFAPAANLFSHPVVVPVLLRHEGGGVTLLAPLDSSHEQVIAVDQDESGVHRLVWGWHGDLDEVPAGFRSTLGVYEGRSAGELLRRWGGEIRAAAGTVRLGRDADPVVSHLSYWTDNGAAYWYRTEPGRDLPTTLEAKLDELRSLEVPVRSVELDSWFYPHETSRPVAEVGYLDDVPPTGMLEWSARPDVLPDGVDGLAERLGRPPLVLHSRHISPESPYLEDGEWWVGSRAAQPVDPSFFRRWCESAAAWGATCIEQDWLLANWFGVRALRSAPGRAVEWQRALDAAAADHGLTLLWCMATPGDFLATVELSRIVAIRTCDDYRFADDPALLWHWYLTVNLLADALGLMTFKDCFFTAPGDGIDGDPYPEAEAVLSAMSAGVVGIGDRIGRTDPAVVARLCRSDGTIVTTDRPVALTDQSLFEAASHGDRLCWASAPVGEWRYVVAFHISPNVEPIGDTFDLGEELLVYDWRNPQAVPATTIDVELGHRDWALFVCCPIEHDAAGGSRTALIGDPAKYVTMGAHHLDPEPGQVLRRWIDGVGLVDEVTGDRT